MEVQCGMSVFHITLHAIVTQTMSPDENKIKTKNLCFTDVSTFIIIILSVYIHDICLNIFHEYLNTYLQNLLDDRNNQCIILIH